MTRKVEVGVRSREEMTRRDGRLMSMHASR